MKRLLTLWCVFASVWALSATAHASGYAIWEQGAAATGRAGAVLASPTDPSTIFFNPAGLADIGGFQAYFGGTMVLPVGGYEAADGKAYERTLRGYFPPNLYLSYGEKDKWAAGLGLFVAFPLGIDWQKDFPGSYRIDRVDLKIPTVQPTFSMRLSKEFSFGVGFNLALGTMAELERDLPLAPYPKGHINLGASGAMGYGGTVGILFTPVSNLRIGANYRSAMKLSFEGKAHFTFDPSIPAAIRTGLPSDQTGNLEITTPHVVGAGVAWDITPNFTIELDWQHFFWSVFEELRLKFGPPPTGGTAVPGDCTPAGSPAGVSHVCSPRNWYDSSQFRLGVEYRPTPKLAVRGGYIFDMAPVPASRVDPILPDSHRHDFSVGVGYQFTSNVRFDFAYMLVYFTRRNSPEVLQPTETAPGQYYTMAHLLGLNLGLKF
jgi:long-chain fatty acid transport protein